MHGEGGPEGLPEKEEGSLTMDEYTYKITNSDGVLVLQAKESCRHPREVELDHLENGYTIKLHGRKITKKEVKAE